MYMPVATPASSTPTAQQATRAAVPCTSGTSQRTTSIVPPMTIALLTVPTPGTLAQRDPEQEHARPTRIDHVPIGMPVCRESPWWSTSHGTSPYPPSTSSDELIP